MIRIAYQCEFISAVDVLDDDNLMFGVGAQITLEEAYDAFSNLHSDLLNAADDWCSANSFPPMKENIQVDKARNKEFNEIESDCGDDEVVTTDSQAYGPVKIIAGVKISRIILSLKDTGISNQLFNYTEGWVLTPPTKESCFEAVNRRHVRDGVPLLLDPVKLKLISPVRKQSKMELDLESKIKKVFENTSWIARWQFSYDYHQLMELLAVNIFDFRDARSFPYLYESEGGSGGIPPWGNLDTAISGIFSFHKGKASKTVYGLCRESTALHMGELKPKDSFFLRSSHIAQLGDKAWLTYDSVYRDILAGRTPSEAASLLNVLAGKDHLPVELLEKGAEIEPSDVIVGTALSRLRADGFVLTELDVKLQLENQKKIRALGGTVPYRQILEEVEKEKEKIKSNSWKVLGEIAGFLQASGQISQGELDTLPQGRDQYYLKRKILQDYYMLRTEKYTTFSSFAYSDAIRVFKTSDVLEYIQKHGNVLRETIAGQVNPRLRVAISQDIVAEKLRKESILSWLDSAELTELLESPLPPGVGPDDGRIVSTVLQFVGNRNATESEKCPSVIFLVSGDRELGRALNMSLRRNYSDRKWLVLQIEQAQYIGLCLNECRLKADGELDYRPASNVGIWNYLTDKYMYLPQEAYERLAKYVRELGADHYIPLVIYDYPNIERAIEPTYYDSATQTVVSNTGGFLRAETIQNFPKSSSWGAFPLSKLYSLPDFSSSRKILYPVRDLPRNRRVYFNKPLGIANLHSIAQWTAAVA